jgi:hypothetical protein
MARGTMVALQNSCKHYSLSSEAMPACYAIELPGLSPQFKTPVAHRRGLLLQEAAVIAPKARVDYKSSAGKGSLEYCPRMIPGPQKDDLNARFRVDCGKDFRQFQRSQD